MAQRPDATPPEGPAQTAKLVPDQLGKVVALRFTGELRRIATPYGDGPFPIVELVTGIRSADGPGPYLHHDIPVYPTVIQRQVTTSAPGDWLVGYIIRPGRSYQLDAAELTDAQFAWCERQIERATPAPEPEGEPA